jgi:hypothetical protein
MDKIRSKIPTINRPALFNPYASSQDKLKSVLSIIRWVVTIFAFFWIFLIFIIIPTERKEMEKKGISGHSKFYEITKSLWGDTSPFMAVVNVWSTTVVITYLFPVVIDFVRANVDEEQLQQFYSQSMSKLNLNNNR